MHVVGAGADRPGAVENKQVLGTAQEVSVQLSGSAAALV